MLQLTHRNWAGDLIAKVGLTNLARGIRVSTATPIRWRERGGWIPTWRRDNILRWAKRHNLNVTRAELGPKRPREIKNISSETLDTLE